MHGSGPVVERDVPYLVRAQPIDEHVHERDGCRSVIVGGDDKPVIEMNRDAMRRMRAPVTLEIVPGATHLFEEPGALEQVARLATDWCRRHLNETPESLDGIAPGELPSS